MKIKKSDLPVDSLMRKYLPANYYDVFSCVTDEEISPDDLMIEFWTKPPKWVAFLFTLRNKIVKKIGLKGADSGDDQSQNELIECIRQGTSYSIFSVEGKSEYETVLKLSDRHLDAYVSAYIVKASEGKYCISISTVVDIHNWLGYVYFYPICPFHKLVVKGMMRHILTKA
ncbi:DUF2867 domain-containing protein [Dysgonomonas massiliensis]|uniref:DUF2867 domain-containing protein n=1 Tax=Dysgonomonas massiliensis TaxID=2040292 RepID=UPI000C77E30E|nr:DUF2867 domain-containing protein [Dysgonomonas massiliensis]